MTYVCLDFETTGLSPKYDEILEIGAIKICDNEIVDSFDTLLCVNGKVTPTISELTGITSDMLTSAPYIGTIIDDFVEFIDNNIIVGHNVTFDLSFLCAACAKFNIPIKCRYIDTLDLARERNPDLHDYKLETLCEVFGISNDKAHRALSDSKATYELFCKLTELDEFIMPSLFEPKDVKPTRNQYKTKYNEQTRSLQDFEQLLLDITDDDILTEDEVYALKKWLERNQHLRGAYPFEKAASAIEQALEDNILEQHELDEMLEIFKELTNPDFSIKEDSKTSIDVNGKKICLTGDFKKGSRSQVSKMLEEKGAEMTSAVSGKTSYLIVGSLGSQNWSNGNYGGKIKKAFEFKDKGKPIQIISEDDFFKLLI